MVEAASRGGDSAIAEAHAAVLQLLAAAPQWSDPSLCPPVAHQWWSIVAYVAGQSLLQREDDAASRTALGVLAPQVASILAVAAEPPQTSDSTAPGRALACAAAAEAIILWHAAATPADVAADAALAAAVPLLQSTQYEVRQAAIDALSRTPSLLTRGNTLAQTAKVSIAQVSIARIQAALLAHVAQEPLAAVRVSALNALAALLWQDTMGASVSPVLCAAVTPATDSILVDAVHHGGPGALSAAVCAAWLISPAKPALPVDEWLTLLAALTQALAAGSPDAAAAATVVAVYSAVGDRLLHGNGDVMAQAKTHATLLRAAHHDSGPRAAATGRVVRQLCGHGGGVLARASDSLTRLGCVESIAYSLWRRAAPTARLAALMHLCDVLLLDGCCQGDDLTNPLELSDTLPLLERPFVAQVLVVVALEAREPPEGVTAEAVALARRILACASRARGAAAKRATADARLVVAACATRCGSLRTALGGDAVEILDANAIQSAAPLRLHHLSEKVE